MNHSTNGRDSVLALRNVSLWLPNGFRILSDINWQVRVGEHWALLGPNGSGKSSLLSLAGATRHPSQGDVYILGEHMGETSVWDLKEQIGVIDPNQKVLEWSTVRDMVLTGVTGTIWPLDDRITDQDRDRAVSLLELLGCRELSEREFFTCSQGEKQRARIARALMADPPLLLLDEPATGLDLPSREALLLALTELTASHPALATVLVSHHLEELPESTTHALILRAGQIVAAGRVEDVLTSDHITCGFGFPVDIARRNGRWSARATGDWRTRR